MYVYFILACIRLRCSIAAVAFDHTNAPSPGSWLCEYPGGGEAGGIPICSVGRWACSMRAMRMIYGSSDVAVLLVPIPQAVRSGISRARSKTIARSVCPVCGTSKKSGMLSCCARGGAWFNDCGDVGDTKFNHTWAEGMQTCKSRLLSVVLL